MDIRKHKTLGVIHLRRFTFAPLNFVFIICGDGVIRNFSVTASTAEKKNTVGILRVLGNIARIILHIPVSGVSCCLI